MTKTPKKNTFLRDMTQRQPAKVLPPPLSRPNDKTPKKHPFLWLKPPKKPPFLRDMTHRQPAKCLPPPLNRPNEKILKKDPFFSDLNKVALIS